MEQPTTRLRVRDYLRFVAWVTFAHLVTYLAAGTLAYFFLYQGENALVPLEALMRNPNDPDEWRHVETWLIPGQILRGLLFGAALSPFLQTLTLWNLRTRFCTLLGLLLVFSVWSVTMPGSGSIEGWIYLKPGIQPTSPNPLLDFIEVPIQLAAFALFVSWRIGKSKAKKAST